MLNIKITKFAICDLIKSLESIVAMVYNTADSLELFGQVAANRNKHN